jgi:hypothetical protein
MAPPRAQPISGSRRCEREGEVRAEMEAGCADAGPTAIAAMMLRACVLAVSAFRFICPELILLCPDSGPERLIRFILDPLSGSDHPHNVGAFQENPYSRRLRVAYISEANRTPVCCETVTSSAKGRKIY